MGTATTKSKPTRSAAPARRGRGTKITKGASARGPRPAGSAQRAGKTKSATPTLKLAPGQETTLPAGAPPLPAHPLSALLPHMTDGEYAALRSSIAAAGKVIDKVVLLDGQILDGRHRERCRLELNLPLDVRAFDPAAEGSPIYFVYSRAVHRNLNDSQKAAAAVRIEAELAKVAKGRRVSNLKQYVGKPWPINKAFTLRSGVEVYVERYTDDGRVILAGRGEAASLPKQVLTIDEARTRLAAHAADRAQVHGRSDEAAGQLFGVSARYVSEAKALLAADKTLFQQVFDGALKLTAAKAEHVRRHRTAQLEAKVRSAGPVDLSGISIVTGDCAASSQAPAGRTRMIFWDPPYNIGIDYGDGEDADRRPEGDYINWIDGRMREASRLLTDDGSFWVLICDEWAAEFAVMLKRLGFTIRNWIKWYETFGNNCASRFNRTSRHLFYATKHPTRCVWHPEAVNRPSARQAVYGDARANPNGKHEDDVWIIPRLVENAAERVPGFPTQIPLELVRRAVECSTDPGDQVIDFCVGSGTTAHQCLLSGRRFLGWEVNSQYACLARARVQAAAAELRKARAAK